MDAEDTLISLLREVAGHQYTEHMYKMYKDIHVSADITDKFQSFCDADKICLGLNFSVKVLQSSSWPSTQKNANICFTTSLEASTLAFAAYFENNYKGRKITRTNVQQMEIALHFAHRKYSVLLDLVPMNLLLPFNKQEVATVKELQIITQLPLAVVLSNLNTLLDLTSSMLIAAHVKIPSYD